MIWLVVAGACVLLLGLCALVPWRFELSLQGRGDPTGAWVLGGGGRFGPFAVSAAAARGVEPRVYAHLFGRTVWQRELGEDEPPPDESELTRARKAVGAGARQVTRRYRQLSRWISPKAALEFMLLERRRVRLDLLSAHLDYSFVDISVTGKMLGAVYALSGLLPPPARITQAISWECVDRATLKLAVEARVWPLLLALDTVWFLLRSVVFGMWARTVRLFREREPTEDKSEEN